MSRKLLLLAVLSLAGCGVLVSDGDDDDDHAPIVEECDGGCWLPPESVCNPAEQTGCAAVQRCTFLLEHAHDYAGRIACVPDGTAPIGAPCSEPQVAGATDDCARGGLCEAGVCRKICTTLNDQCDDGVCVSLLYAAENPRPIDVCLPDCDPLAQDCGEPEQGCYLSRPPACLPAGNTAWGEPCGAVNDCAPGLVCILLPGEFTCRSLCGPWTDCFSDEPVVNACGCGGTTSCASDEICFPIGDGAGGAVSEIAGVCVTGPEVDCDCDGSPICPG